jgi:hypothetical protein
MSTWSGWATEAGCNGVKTRTRSIVQQNNRCGEPCKGALKETAKATLPDSCSNPNQDCKLSEWEPWSTCEDRFDQAWTIKHFLIHSHGNGSGCNGTKNMTKACGTKATVVNCSFADWGTWTKCSKTCGGGHQSRYRRFKHKSTFLGTPCTGAMNNFQVCSTGSCPDPRPCTWGEWTQWAGCDATDQYQMVRRRNIEEPPAGTSQLPCNGTTRETRGCNYDSSKVPTACTLGDWSAYGPCTKSCEGGQKSRYRVMLMPPKNGGTCPTQDLIETVECNQIPCTPNVCVYTDWADWEACSQPCGPGTKRRARSVNDALTKPEEGGCTGSLKEIVACETKPCQVDDCKWALWQDWSGCTASCGGGTMRRNRFIQVAPQNGGKMCMNETKAEVKPCNTQTCMTGCISGAWNDWSVWSQCSKSCGGAYQSRKRTVKVAANWCGEPVQGKFDEFRMCQDPANPPCEEPVDCKLSDWTEWGACSGSCFGIRERHRTIQQFPQRPPNRTIAVPRAGHERLSGVLNSNSKYRD